MMNKLRKTALFLITGLVLGSMTGCSYIPTTINMNGSNVLLQEKQSQETESQETAEDVLRKIVSVYETEESAVEHFGTVKVSETCDYIEDGFSFTVGYTTDGKTFSLLDFEDRSYLYNDGNWYVTDDISADASIENLALEDITFGMVVDYEAEKDQIAILENYFGQATYTESEERLTNDSYSMKITPVGYELSTTAEGEDDILGHWCSDTTLTVNKDYRIDGIDYLCRNDDGDLIYTETLSYEYGVPNPLAVDAYNKKMADAEGKNRTLTQHILMNNEEIETYVYEVPLGFDASVYFADEIMYSIEEYGYGVFLDRNVTIPAPKERDLYDDLERYYWLYESDVDYSDDYNWAYKGEDTDFDVDVFFIAPTVGKSDSYNMSIDNEKFRKSFVGATNMEKGIYDVKANFYAPYYRQTSLESYDLTTDERSPYALLAYDDISKAFDYYMDNLNEGRPYIIAGFSQGGELVKRLICDQSEIDDRMIAAYAIGWYFSEEDLEKNPNLKMAQDEDDLGVIVSFCSEAPDYKGNNIVAPVKTHGINPLNWKTDYTLAEKEENKGSCFTDYSGDITKEEKGLCGAYRDEERGTLKVTDVNTEDYPPVLSFLEDGNFHLYDYQFFYRNLQENVETRIDKYFEIAQ